jgi:probable F420-dependent oxidoreductase
MAHPHPFRFGVQSRTLGPRAEWLDSLRWIEANGYSTYVVMDHFVRGLDPIATLGAAAIATTTLRLGSMVFDNDFRHPAVLAKAMATVDVLSEGRLEIGIGAGWLREEYDQAGIPFDPAGVRIDRMVEAVHLMKRIFAEERVTFAGEHYRTQDQILVPKPVQQPHPPFVIGGGSKRILSIAAREAATVNITTRALPDGSKDVADMTPDRLDTKIGWVRDAAGDRFAEIELASMVSDLIVTGDRQGEAERLAGSLGVTADDVLASPHILIGTVDQMVEDLQQRRERFGMSYFIVLEGDREKLAPVVARLAGA